jgi:AAA domain
MDIMTTCNGEPVRVLWFPAEVYKKELRRQHHNIKLQTHPANHRDEALRIVQPRDKVLAVYDSDTGLVKPTESYAEVCAEIETIKPHVVITNNRVNIFSIDQNNDAQVHQCMQLLNDLCMTYGITVIMPAPTTGSVQWLNACRTCCRLSQVEDQYQLEVVKSNYAEAGKAINLKMIEGDVASYAGGVFVEEYVPVDAMVEQEFMDMLRKETLSQNWVSPQPTARTFAPRIFSAASDCKYRGSKGMRAFTEAMRRLYTKGVIQSVEYKSAPSRPGSIRIEEVTKGGPSNATLQ